MGDPPIKLIPPLFSPPLCRPQSVEFISTASPPPNFFSREMGPFAREAENKRRKTCPEKGHQEGGNNAFFRMSLRPSCPLLLHMWLRAIKHPKKGVTGSAE